MRRSSPLLPSVLLLLHLALSLTPALAKQKPIRYLTYSQATHTLHALAAQNPSLLTVHSAHTFFPDLPLPPSQCSASPCETLIAEFGGDGPAVLVLGPLHGDERVSAAAALHLVALLISESRRDPWIARLVRTRRIVVVPLPSAAAYDAGARHEEGLGGGVDPATDFPFARGSASSVSCLKSSAAMIVDALFRKFTFVVALQLADVRGLQESVTFSWASSDRSMCTRDLQQSDANRSLHGFGLAAACASGFSSPDDAALRTIAAKMSAFAGPSHHADESTLAVGAHNELFAPGGGGFLDYAYAGSSRPELVSACARARPTNGSHRAAAFLISASREAAPEEGSLGRLDLLYNHEPQGNVVTRILRALLVGVDFAEPYVVWLDGDNEYEARGGIAHIRWSVGGAAAVKETWLTCRIDDDAESEWRTPAVAGKTMWSQSFDDKTGLAFHKLHKLSSAAYEFRETLLLYARLSPRQRNHGCQLHLKAEAVVDAEWAGLWSQSHLVQLRTNESWSTKDGERLLRGARIVSTPLLVIDVPPVSGIAAFIEYVWNSLLLAVMVCIFPPVALLYFTRRASMSPSPLLRQRMRATFRRLSRRDGSQHDRAKDLRAGYRRDISVANLLGSEAEYRPTLQR